jgi:hypothetical protein
MTLTYHQHYLDCVNSAALNAHAAADTDNIDSLGVRLIDPSDVNQYQDLLQSLRLNANTAFEECGKNTTTTPFSTEIIDPLEFAEVQQIFDLFYEEIKENIYGCDFTTNAIQIYRSHPNTAAKEASWLWHYDDNPDPHLKLFIYLSEVGEASAPFTYLIDKGDNARKMTASRISPTQRTAQEFIGSRIPDSVIEQYKLFSYRERALCGNAGTSFVFDPNIIHKATVPHEGKSREVLVYHIHPVSSKRPCANFVGQNVKIYGLD